MSKVALNHNVHEHIFETFQNLCEELGPPKYKILEACVEAFSALPLEMQYRLKAQNEEDREICFGLLRAMRTNRQSKKHAQQAKTSKPSKSP